MEIAYYITFIVLTYLLVKYARKTYLFETQKEHILLCQFCIRKETVGDFGFGFALEVYNAGNAIAKNVEIFAGKEKITTIDFIRPNGSFLYPVGTAYQTMGGNHISGGSKILLNEGENVAISLHVDGKVIDYSINPDVVFASRNCTGTLRGIEDKLEDIANNINSEYQRKRYGR